jgi:hypothetical protein
MVNAIRLEVYGGLCNRLRALVSGICLAEDLRRKLIVYWPIDRPECQAAFHDLYQLSSLPPYVRIVDGICPTEWVVCRFPNEAAERVRKGGAFRSLTTFYRRDLKRWHNHLHRLLPLYCIQQRVCDNIRGLPLRKEIVAVHVRRTDHRKAIDGSPLSAFEKEMRAMPKACFCVATDEGLVVKRLRTLFPGRIYSFETLRRRNTIEGVREAVASLYTLALCSRLLGSFNSSFSEMIAQLRQRPVKTVLKHSS